MTIEEVITSTILAICQQHPDYQYRLRKNRARDFYDIHALTMDIGPGFIEECRNRLGKVFLAKEVPLSFLSVLWDAAFIDEQGRGFEQVEDTVNGSLDAFEVYVEHLRFLVRDIYPSAVAE
jgi:hypothetical protein